MKAMTTSELNAKLIEKGFKVNRVNEVPKNKWGADWVSVEEYRNGTSYLSLQRRTSVCSSVGVLSYSKCKAVEKHEVADFLLSIEL
jgi:hypothetical protein